MSGGALELACAARRDYVPHCAAMIDSAIEHSERPVSVRFLHGPDLRRGQARKLGEMVRARGGEIEFLTIPPERVAGLRTLDSLPSSHWYRVFLPELLPQLERVLYLDADAIAVDSLEPLWQSDLGGHAVAAVTNVFQHDHVEIPARLGIDRARYFNTGVLLIDLEAFRTDGLADEVLAAARAKHELLAFPEQDAMNVVLADRRLALHPRWNLMNSILLFASAEAVLGARAVAEARERPAIRHFEGPSVNKPWHLLCERDGAELYRRHRRRTPWPRVRPAGITPANLLRRARRGARPPGSTPPR